jgi:hypothetical protein
VIIGVVIGVSGSTPRALRGWAWSRFTSAADGRIISPSKGVISMDKGQLAAAIARSGWTFVTEERITGLLSKLVFLERTGRYGKLLANIAAANDKNNLSASILEATIAFQFESAGIPLDYEVRQSVGGAGSIDFCWTTESGLTVYIEVRLLQQDATTARSISSQLAAANVYTISLDGDDEKRDIIRLQQVIMEKVQKRDGTPTKFVAEHPGAVNLVAVDVSSIILGMFDQDDCKLVTLGDCSVQPAFQRGIFGLFQEPDSRLPQEIQAVADGFAHIRSTLHGILFLFRAPKSEPFDYSLERCLERNPRLMDQGTAKTIREAFQPALPLNEKSGHLA